MSDRKNKDVPKRNYSVRTRSACRICGSKRVMRYLSLPDMPLTDNLLSEDELGGEFLFPIDVFFCQDCLASQTLHDVTSAGYYDEYEYSVGGSSFVRRFMERLSKEVWERFSLRRGDSVIEVGSGDGAQLSFFKSLGARVLGFEPSHQLCEASRRIGVDVVTALFDAQSTERIPSEMRPARVILLEYTFDHLPEPGAFLRQVRDLLDPNRGVVIIEVHDLERIFDRCEYCLFDHEHTTYMTAATMQRFLAREGLTMLAGHLVPYDLRRGNSLLIAAVPEESVWSRSLGCEDLPADRFRDPETYRHAGKRILATVERMREIIKTKRSGGARLAGYGAGGRGIATLAASADPGDIEFLCDRNPAIHGKYTPKSHVPICEPQRLFKDITDETIVFSFGYFQEIAEQLRPYTAKGGELISLLDLLNTRSRSAIG